MTSQRISLRVSPGGSRTQWMGRMADGRLKVRVGAPPEGGRANRELVRFVAESLGVPQRAVRVVAGLAARDKVLECDADPDRVQRCIELAGRSADRRRQERPGGGRLGNRRRET